jgi:carboxyl-terminal processing protease
MTQPSIQIKRRLALLAVLAGFLLIPALAPADVPAPTKQDRLVTQLVCTFLQRGHLTQPELDAALSKRVFQRFFKDLDPTKCYFLKSDIEDFRKDETKLGAQLKQGDISFAYHVYERFVTRIGQRQKLIEELVKAPHDFTVKESLSTDYDALDYAQSEDELRERWRKRIKFDLLLERIAKKPLPEAEAKQKILTRYQGMLKRWKQVDNYDLLELYLSDLTTSVDPHSSYMSPNTLDDFDIAMRLHLEGIGAVLRSENGQTIVVEVVPGGAAAADGRLKPKDKIIAVSQGDGQFTDVVDMKLREVVKLIRGPRNSKVQLKIVHADTIEPITLDMTRQRVELKSQEARGEIIEQGKKADGTPNRIGVIDLPSFYSDMSAARTGRTEIKSATDDVRKILRDFNAKRVDGIVLDLRRNGGGALSEALALTGLFLDQGPVVQVKGSDGRVIRHDDPERGMAYSGPLMVLVSKLSASASEILAGALQDYGRALVVGDTATHGKGTVQAVIDLGSRLQAEEPPKLGALKLTIQQFYRVNGDSTQDRGVASDIVLPSLTEELATCEKELDYAIPFDQVRPVEHERLGLVPADALVTLRARSAERIKNSKEFAILIKEMEQIRTRRAKKEIPLNEKDLRDQVTREDAEKANKKDAGLDEEEPPSDSTPFKFKRTYVNNEVLQIMEDFLKGKKLISGK